MAKNVKEWTIEDMSKDVLRQRNKLEIDSREMSDDIVYYFKKIFNENNIVKYTFTTNYTIVLKGQSDLVRSLTYDKEKDMFLIGFVLPERNVEFTKGISPLEQAKLFDYFVADFRSQLVYVVIEEVYDQEIQIAIPATFKKLDTAKKFLENRVAQQQTSLNPHIWEQATKEGAFEDKDKIYYRNEETNYYVCSREYYYKIQIVPQVVF